ncbi:MAG: WecB/TagA/CpsF family glycosyltransferase, partial [Nitrincola sp.]|nr:WecB/TagA/CpsF family glycosyltransferase [Nitrincola sp.]
VVLHDPGRGDVASMSTPEIIEKINLSQADFLVVSLGAKKGQAWILHNLDKIQVPVVSHLGAVVNFVAGTVKRAPKVWQKLGLEWLWRIVEEPYLWKRYASDGFAALKMATCLLKKAF